MWRNDMICKYILMFPVKNVARKFFLWGGGGGGVAMKRAQAFPMLQTIWSFVHLENDNDVYFIAIIVFNSEWQIYIGRNNADVHEKHGKIKYSPVF